MLRLALRPLSLSLLLFALIVSLAAAAPAGKRRAPAPDELGPWAVGRQLYQVVDFERLRGLTIDAWYPVDPEDAAGAPPSVYDLIFANIVSDVALNAPPSDARRFPLIVFSHGSGGLSIQSYFLAEHLASHGFVVIAPGHVGNTALDLLFPGTPFEASDRPLDVSLVITDLLEKDLDPASPFFGRIDPWRIGVAGHSFGGFTTLAMSAGFQDVPPDPRVRALMPIAPVSTAFSDEELAAIDEPLFILGGTSDITTPIDPQSVRAFEQTVTRPAWRVDVEKAGHNSFTNVCDLADALSAVIPPELIQFLIDSALEGCAPELIPIEEAHRITSFYATSFFKVHLEGDRRFRRFLKPPSSQKMNGRKQYEKRKRRGSDDDKDKDRDKAADRGKDRDEDSDRKKRRKKTSRPQDDFPIVFFFRR